MKFQLQFWSGVKIIPKFFKRFTPGMANLMSLNTELKEAVGQSAAGFFEAVVQKKAELDYILVDEDDVDVVALDELLEAVLDVGNGSVLVDDHEVGLPVLVHLADAAQEEPNAGVLKVQKRR